jgi:DNA topoisomerase I
MTPPDNLIYYPDAQPGIRRKRRGRGFSYLAPDGTRIDCAAERARIASLAVPPAYESVWICPLENGHLQATGLDARGRKQYRYHPHWTAHRAERKYGNLAAFGDALPGIRRRIRRDLSHDAGDVDFAIAAVLAMLDRLSMRIGNADYATENKTYGATTLCSKHLRLSDDGVILDFRAKGGLRVRRAVNDRGLNRALGKLHDLPGATLVSWLDATGKPHAVTSDMVNARLNEIGQHGFTAKTFRTWAGSEAAMAVALSEEKLSLRTMAEAAAARLHNTPSIARGSYIHPSVLALAGQPLDERRALADDLPEREGLRLAERALLRLIA